MWVVMSKYGHCWFFCKQEFLLDCMGNKFACDGMHIVPLCFAHLTAVNVVLQSWCHLRLTFFSSGPIPDLQPCRSSSESVVDENMSAAFADACYGLPEWLLKCILLVWKWVKTTWKSWGICMIDNVCTCI